MAAPQPDPKETASGMTRKEVLNDVGVWADEVALAMWAKIGHQTGSRRLSMDLVDAVLDEIMKTSKARAEEGAFLVQTRREARKLYCSWEMAVCDQSRDPEDSMVMVSSRSFVQARATGSTHVPSRNAEIFSKGPDNQGTDLLETILQDPMAVETEADIEKYKSFPIVPRPTRL